jgi:hypothetical protein
MKTKQVKLVLTKTQDGYIVGNETLGKVDYLGDSDQDRKKLINILIEDFINVEIEEGRKYN